MMLLKGRLSKEVSAAQNVLDSAEAELEQLPETKDHAVSVIPFSSYRRGHNF